MQDNIENKGFKNKTMTDVLINNKTHELRHAFSGFTGNGSCDLCGYSGFNSFRSLYSINYPTIPDLKVCPNCETNHWNLMQEKNVKN